jgi:hypothetical protein
MVKDWGGNGLLEKAVVMPYAFNRSKVNASDDDEDPEKLLW